MSKTKTAYYKQIGGKKYDKSLLDLAESLVAPVEVIEEVVEKGVAGVIAVMETLPLIMKRHFPELTGDQITLVKSAVAECRNAMADVEVQLDSE